MLAGELMLNRSAFTGEDIVNKRTDSLWEKTTKAGDYLWKAWMPSAAWVPGSWYWTKIENAAKGARDAGGQPYSLPEAVASSVGIKLHPQDIEQNYVWRAREFKRVERDLRADVRRIERDYERGFIDHFQRERELIGVRDKLDRLGAEARERLAPRSSR